MAKNKSQTEEEMERSLERDKLARGCKLKKRLMHKAILCGGLAAKISSLQLLEKQDKFQESEETSQHSWNK